MKFVVDEQLPPALARSLNALFAGEHEVIHIRDRFGSGDKDDEWIATLSAEGRWIVISADRGITRSPAERLIFRGSRLVGFFMSKGVYKAKLTKQMERIMALWDTIIAQAKLVQGGAMFVLPMKSTRLQQLR